MAGVVSSGEKFRLLRTGGPGLLSVIIAIVKKMAPGKDELYPTWQGMQYMRNMIDKRADLKTMHNNRYPGIQFTSVKYLLRKHQERKG